MIEYTNYCTTKQTERAYKLGAPLETFDPDYNNGVIIDNKTVAIPTTQQMIGWLDTKSLHITTNMAGWSITILLEDDTRNIHQENRTDSSITILSISRKDNELSAINAALDYLEK